MKRLLLLFLIVSCEYLYSQSTPDSIINEQHSAPLTYEKSIPSESSYKIIKNTSNDELPKTVLEMINFHRKHNENYLWRVNNEIEILIFKIK